MIETRLLSYFLAVAREGSITRAANTLHITQPTLSRQIAQLEDELGVTLFDRTTRHLALTEEGVLLRRRAEEILELTHKTERELHEVDRELAGTIAVGGGDTAASWKLAQLMTAFSRLHPQVTFDFYTATADIVAERMERGLIDIGFFLEPIDIQAYEYLPLDVEDRWSVAMRPDDPLAAHDVIAPRDLIDAPLILPRRSDVQQLIAHWFEGEGVNPHVVAVNDLNSSSAVMAQEGLGYAVLVEGSLTQWNAARLALRPLAHAPRCSSVVAWRRGKPLGNASRHFVTYLRSALTEVEGEES